MFPPSINEFVSVAAKIDGDSANKNGPSLKEDGYPVRLGRKYRTATVTTIIIAMMYIQFISKP